MERTTLATAELIRRKVRRSAPGTFVRTTDFPGPRAAVLAALSRLHAEGELVRVRNGLYWKGVNSRYGKGSPDRLAAAMAVTGDKGVGPSGWSATQALGFSTQVPATPQLAITGPAPTLKGVRFHTRNNAARRDLSFLEIALLETLREFPRYAEVELDEVARKAAELDASRIRLGKIEKVAASERSPKLRANLAAMLDIINTPHPVAA